MITYPLNNIDYTAEDAELYFSTRESGVYDGNDFEVTASGIDNDVTVGTGIAWIHNTKFSGKVVALKEPQTLTLSLPNSVYDRIDAIVIQFDANENATEIVVKEGIASSSPVAPNVVRTESLYELHIFHIQRQAGATVIGVDDLIDLRNNSDYCGIMFDPISSIDPTLTKTGYAADAKAVGIALNSMGVAHNLLRNGNFAKPVNQDGETSYNQSGYTIDCWKYTNSNGVLTIEDGYINLTAASANSHWRQPLEHKLASDKTYTFAIRVKGSGNGYLGVYNSAATSSAIAGLAFSAESDWKTVALVISNKSNVDLLTIRCDAGANLDIEWAALYEGEFNADSMPNFVANDFGAELAECQRFYMNLGNINASGIVYNDATTGALWIYLPCQMRVTPSLLSGSIGWVRANGVQIGGGTMAIAGQYGNTIRFSLTGLTTGAKYCAVGAYLTDVKLDARLL